MMWILFIYFATICVVAGVLTVALRNAVHCAMALLTLLLHMAGLFVMLNAEFLAAVQIIVYAGAILILYLFVLMLMNLKTEEQHLHKKHSYLLFAGMGLFAELLILLMLSPYGGTLGTATSEVILTTGPSHAVGITMFSDYLLLFEIVGIFLLGAVIGAIVLAKTPAKTDTQEPANSPAP
ncbi:MAG: NADH-quinone oxidoreductase subunit J [Nitrospirota bacterium]|nr:MAG: NADH-quinone oxidoreductase subunit J [Nitrospirota bacterium]